MIPTEPPLAPQTVLPLDRRTLIKGGLIGAGLVAAPLSAQIGERGFTHGVASGEPGARRVLLWTRYVAGQDTDLALEVSETLDFTTFAAEGSARAVPNRDFTARTFAEGLLPGRWYYYRFRAPDGSLSDVGRTRTLPEGETERFRMAVFSCANIGFGWFNAYAHAAAADEFDCALHLGDYLYEYPPGTYPSSPETVPGRTTAPDGETVALADYRTRYAHYRRDADLRRLHQLYPMIATWDDHESANDSWEGGAQNHQPETEGPWAVRKAAAMQAWREWMPVSDEAWAAYQVGNLATLFRLDTRLSARAEPLSFESVLTGQSGREETIAALAAFRHGVYQDPSRELLGSVQQDWLASGLRKSTGSGTVWQVLVQQVLMGALAAPAELAERLGPDAPEYVRQRVAAGALASRAGLPMNLDAWDGYPAARAKVFEAALAADANLISLAGDTHNAWAFDLAHGDTPVGIEFGGQSVASPGIESYLPQLVSGDFQKAAIARNPQLKWADSSHRGYMAVELTRTQAICEYRFLETVRTKATGLAGTKRVTSLARSRKLDIG